jgi:glycosyltransferase involved in cell wall biosynthesis
VVSVIVPARNEEASLGSCLESLASQTGINFEIIVVDDDSSDRTAEIARRFAIPHSRGTEAVETVLTARPVLVIRTPALPEGWTGKNNAMAAGAKIAKGKWLLFTDADTTHKPGSLERAVREAEQHEVSMLSYSPEQEVRTFWERAVMPVIFGELAATYPPKKVTDPASPIAAANGQYLLILREAYDAVGGHRKISGDLLEDVALARLVKSSGRKILFRYGGDAVRTRMYHNWSQMKEGWTKNLALLFPRPRTLAWFHAVEFALIVGNLAAAVIAWLTTRAEVGCATFTLAMLVAAAAWLRIVRAHFARTSNFTAIAGIPVFVYLLFRSVSSHRRSRVSWKGRRYHSHLARTISPGAPGTSSADATRQVQPPV